MDKNLGISILEGYLTYFPDMIPKLKHTSIQLITSILSINVFDKLSKNRKEFLETVLLLFLSIKGKINFLQFARFSNKSEQTFRNHFDEKFDFTSFNKLLIKELTLKERITVMDPTYIPKAGKTTYGRAKFWSGAAKTAKFGLEICGFAVVDVLNNTALHLHATQSPSPDILKTKNLNLLGYYANLIREQGKALKEFSDYLVLDAYFSKKTIADSLIQSKMHLSK